VVNYGELAMTRSEAVVQIAVVVVGWHLCLTVILWIGLGSGAIPLAIAGAIAGSSLAVSGAVLGHARGRT
jgi:hypothetical protein